MSKINEFTNKYQLSKTLRFKLIPEGKTEENFKAAHILEEDKIRAEKYIKVKGYLDRYYRDFIDTALSNVKLEGVREYAELYYKTGKTDADKKQIKAKEENLRKQIAAALHKGKNYEALFKKEIIRELLPGYLTDSEEREIAESFEEFTTYFTGFFENRANMFTDEEKSTGIAYRCINDNLPRFLDNARIFSQICDGLQNEWAEIEATFSGLFGTEVNDLFSLDYFAFVLSQSGIDAYNQAIGGYTNDDKSKVKGINEYVNLHNQTALRENRLPKLKTLHKQILSEGSTFSYIPEEFQDDQAVLDAVNCFLGKRNDDTDTIAETLEKLKGCFAELSESGTDGVYVKNDAALTDISVGVFGRWDAVRSAWEEEYDNSHKVKASEKYQEDRRKAFKNAESFSLSEIDRLGSLKCSEDKENVGTARWLNAEFDSRVNAFEQANEAARELLSTPYNAAKKLSQNEDAIVRLKSLLDAVKDLERFAGMLCGTGKEESKNEEFYGEFLPRYERLREVDRLYDRVRNHMTKKPFSTDKIKLNFENPQFLGGWDRNKEADYSAVLLCKDGQYYVAVMPRHSKKAFENVPEAVSGEPVYRKMVYKLLPGPNKMLPKVFFSEKGLKQFNPPPDVLENYQKKTHLLGENFCLDDCYALIDFFKDAINRHPDWKKFDFHFSDTSAYRNISDFYTEVKNQGYKITFADVPVSYVDRLVNSGELYLFRIYNKDFSVNSHGTPNMHTLYFRALFDEDNLKNVVFKLNGESEMFYREASIRKEEQVIHPSNNPIKNKNPKNPKKDSLFNYDLVKDKRYTQDQFMLHMPITINFTSAGNGNMNNDVRKALKYSEHNYVIGIDRGERNLLYISVVDENGHIAEQYSLNEIVNEYKGISHTVDYNALLEKKEAERMDARKNWSAIENIRDLKEGYISQVIHKICELVEKYDAVIAMEDLNFGFKSGRMKVERSVYQKFEKMLIDKLNFYVNKQRTDPAAPGGLYNAYQLTVKFESFKKMGKQNGFIFYVPAWLTSKIDPVSGFADLLYPRYESVSASKDFFEKFDRIAYSKACDTFEFAFDYGKFKGGVTSFRKKWTLYSYGERIRTFRNPTKNNEWDSETVNLTEEFKKLFSEYNIPLSDNMKDAILEQDSRAFYEALTKNLKLLLQMRNSKTGTDEDYLISPVKNADGTFYCSNDYKGEKAILPIDADANGAYNIARKAHMLIARIKETPDEELEKMRFAISNAEWLEYAQKSSK